MKVIKDPIQEKYGICYSTYFTDEFKKLIESAEEKIELLSKKEISREVHYFKIKEDEDLGKFDCCDDEKCIKQAKIDIRKQFGKGIHIEEHYYDNDGDHENIEICSQCGKPLNEWLTWCNSELEYIEENKPWTVEFIKEQGFLIHCILQSMPTMDCSISEYDKYQGGEIFKKALESREQFFQRIGKLAQFILESKLKL